MDTAFGQQGPLARAAVRLGAGIGAIAALLCAARAQPIEELKRLSIEDLANVEITSVSKRVEPLGQAPASVYVITGEDIRRSGAISLPEALRLAPNLMVARRTAQEYAISARGFNSTDASNKLLVLIDGRAVYAPVHSGVFWDQQQVPLDDIERIEVVSGPGGTLWGANAVNGVINIITKNARDTQGGLVDLKAGSVDQNGLVRYGGRFGESGAYRVYGMGFGTGHTDLPGGASARDDWHGGQAGFRTDWQGLDDSVTLTGDFYRNNNALEGRQYGGNVMGRWTHRFADGSDLLLQSSYDRQHRVAPGVSESYDSYDLQAQQTLYLGRHVVVLGGEYRIVRDDFLNNSNIFVLIPQRRTVGIGDLFVQDTFALTEDLKLTFGTKVEDSTYTGFSVLPSVRLGWTVSENTFLWAAVSRAVRTPSRIDRELTAPGILAPALDFRSETLTAYEIGYRGRPTPTTSLSVSLYYNVYDDLRTTSLSGISGLPLQLQNGAEGTTYGMEAWGDWRVVPWWRLSAGVNLLHKDLRLKPGVVDLSGWRSEGYDPGYQFSFRSSMDLAHNVELDVGVRAVSSLTYAPVNSYVDADARIGWHVNERLELSLAGYNLFGPHAETIVPAYPAFQARRSVYLGLRWKF